MANRQPWVTHMPTAREILTNAKLGNTHWGRRIIAAERRGAFTSKDNADSRSWQTCACGKQDPRIPRCDPSPGRPGDPSMRWDLCPTDSQLAQMGSDFFDAVSFRDFQKAAKLVVGIEARSVEVLAEERRKDLASVPSAILAKWGLS